jgi:hypothetical protein
LTVLRRKLLKTKETTKLFYNDYLYKLEIRNSLSNYFREKNLSLARNILDSLQSLYDHGDPLEIIRGLRKYSILEEDYFDARRLYSMFSNNTFNYKLRVRSNYMSIYSNNFQWLENIIAQLQPDSIISLYKPDSSVLNEIKKNTIIVKNDNGYQYRVTFGNKLGEQSFAQWAEANPKQVKIGSICLETSFDEGYVDGMYFYIRDEKTLQLCSLVTNNIRRVDKLIVKSNIDK